MTSTSIRKLHRTAEQSRRPDLHHHRRPVKTGVKFGRISSATSLYSSYRLKRHHQDPRIQPAELPAAAAIRPYRSGPGRGRSRFAIRRFYLKQTATPTSSVVAALTEYDPGQSGFLVTLKIEEGQQYFGSPRSSSSPASPRSTRPRCAASRASASARPTTPRRWTSQSRKCRSRPRGAATPSRSGRPRGDRNFEQHTVTIALTVDIRPANSISSASISAATPALRDYA